MSLPHTRPNLSSRFQVTRALALGCVGALWALCGCSAGSAGPFSATALTITGGNLQTGCLLAPLPESLEVTLTGSNGQPLAGEPVTWRVTGGSATLSSTVRPTDPTGRSRVQLALGLALSPIAVSASAGGAPAVSFSATGRVASFGLGQTTSSTLNGSSCTFVGGGPFDAYALTLAGTQAFTVSLASDSFDATLEVVGEGFALGGAFNFDSVPGKGVTNSFLKMIATGGIYGIAAGGQTIGAAGSYTLATATVPVYADSCLSDIWVTRGIVTQQELRSTDCVDGSGPYYFDPFQLILVAGQSVTITESSTAFDAELFVHSSSGNVIFDDNGGGGTNARLSYTNTSTGAEVLFILPSTATVGATGAYTLTIDPPAASR
ncbi:MAG TPA: Ig-like domain-containing protein [Gemmatimonadales bacterium]|nr:Ig-like domain-containing protein [Gemmatimonadales bacterium]